MKHIPMSDFKHVDYTTTVLIINMNSHVFVVFNAAGSKEYNPFFTLPLKQSVV